MGSALRLLLCLGLVAAAPVEAATLHVNSLLDPTETGKCTLRDAIAAANTNAPSGGCPAGDPGADRIVFDVMGVLQVEGGSMWIQESLDISGPGADALTLRGPGGDGPLVQTYGLLSFFNVKEQSAVFRLAGATIARGRGLAGGGVTFYGWACSPRGMGVLIIDRCVFQDNIATYGSAIAVDGSRNGRLEILDTTFTGANAGGASVIAIWNTALTMTNTTIATTGSRASVSLGYVSQGCPSSATDREPHSAQSQYSAQLVNCTLAGSDQTALQLLESEDYDLPGAVLLTLRGTILAGHAGGNVVSSSGGVVTSLGDNLSSDGTGADATRPDDLPNTDARLGPLAYNGGPVPTFLPLPGSPAIDRIPASRCATTSDARGAPRPLDGDGDGIASCDIGAVEAPGPPLAESVALVLDRDTCDIGTRCGPTAVVTGPSGAPLAGRRLTFVVTGANPTTGAATSDAAGRAVFSYVGRSTGTDSVEAVFMDANGAPHRSGNASLLWRGITADLSVSLVVAPALVAPGGTLVHSIVPRNAGPSPATDVVLDLTLPAGLEVVSLRPPAGWSCEIGGGGVRCTSASTGVGAAVAIEVVTRLAPTIAAGAVLTVLASVSSATADPEPRNAKSSVSVTVTASAPTPTRLVPIVLDATSGAARFTTELTLTNRGSWAVAATLRYTPSLGSREGGGDVTLSLPAGRQLVIPDVLATLRGSGLAIPAPSPLIPQGGTLLVTFAGARERGSIAALARTTTPTRAPQPAGSVGVAYPGIDTAEAVTGIAHVFGLRESDSDRSNVAILGSGADPVTVKVTVVNGAGDGRSVVVREAVTLPPLGWAQLDRVLEQAGFAQGYVRVERVSAAGSFHAYGIVNTDGTDDGSFLPAMSGARGSSVLTVPVVAEFPGSRLASELVLANRGPVPATLRLTYAESLNPGLGPGGTVQITLGPKEQRLFPSALDLLRTAGVAVGPKGRAGYAGALRIDVAGADPSVLFAGARTVTSTASGGPYGLFTPAIPGDATASSEAFVFGLQATGATRSNVALSNAGTSLDGEIELEVQAFDGDADGVARGPARRVRLGPGIWEQIYGPLKDAGIANGWVRVTRVSGTAPWIAYGVLNDGGSPGERSGDGAYVPMTP